MARIQQRNEFEVWLRCVKNKIVTLKLSKFAEEAENLVVKLVDREIDVRDVCRQFSSPSDMLFLSMYNAIGLPVRYFCKPHTKNPCCEIVIGALMWICEKEFSGYYESKRSSLLKDIEVKCDEKKDTKILKSVNVEQFSRFISFVQISIDLSVSYNKRRRVLKLSGLCDSPDVIYCMGSGATVEARIRDAIILVMTGLEIQPRAVRCVNGGDSCVKKRGASKKEASCTKVKRARDELGPVVVHEYTANSEMDSEFEFDEAEAPLDEAKAPLDEAEAPLVNNNTGSGPDNLEDYNLEDYNLEDYNLEDFRYYWLVGVLNCC